MSPAPLLTRTILHLLPVSEADLTQLQGSDTFFPYYRQDHEHRRRDQRRIQLDEAWRAIEFHLSGYLPPLEGDIDPGHHILIGPRGKRYRKDQPWIDATYLPPILTDELYNRMHATTESALLQQIAQALATGQQPFRPEVMQNWESLLLQEWKALYALVTDTVKHDLGLAVWAEWQYASIQYHYKGQHLAWVKSTDGDFPWSCGYLIPTDHLWSFKPYEEWTKKLVDIESYHPWDASYLEDSPEYPQDDQRRFEISDNYKAIQQIQAWLKWAQEQARDHITLHDIQQFPHKEEDLWGWEAIFETNPTMTCTHLQNLAEYLDYRNWLVCDHHGKEKTEFPYPPSLGGEDLRVCWR